jgi:hypothetical protein
MPSVLVGPLPPTHTKNPTYRNLCFFVALHFRLLGGIQRRTYAAFCFMPGVEHQSRLMPVALEPQHNIKDQFKTNPKYIIYVYNIYMYIHITQYMYITRYRYYVFPISCEIINLIFQTLAHIRHVSSTLGMYSWRYWAYVESMATQKTCYLPFPLVCMYLYLPTYPIQGSKRNADR